MARIKALQDMLNNPNAAQPEEEEESVTRRTGQQGAGGNEMGWRAGCCSSVSWSKLRMLILRVAY